jgi:hypothetical protein
MWSLSVDSMLESIPDSSMTIIPESYTVQSMAVRASTVDHVLFQNHARNAFLPKNIGFSSLRKSYENRTTSNANSWNSLSPWIKRLNLN